MLKDMHALETTNSLKNLEGLGGGGSVAMNDPMKTGGLEMTEANRTIAM